MNTQRRTFRGRGGPTDGRLPKHNARRRKQTKTNNTEPKYPGPAPTHLTRQVSPPEDWDGSDSDSDGGDHVHTNKLRQERVDDTDRDTADDSSSLAAPITPTTGAQAAVTDALDEHDETTTRCLQEISHLKRRIRNVQEGIQTSQALASPDTYQENVLNPVQNCVNEWRSIARHYGTMNHDGVTDDSRITGSYLCMPNDSRKDAGLAIFQLIQLSLQSGPLKGGKPGYFKRCGSQVARTVAAYLEEVIPNDVLGECMGLTSKQLATLNLWKRNAETAAQSEKGPSKSALKQMQQTHQQQTQQKPKNKM